MSMNNNQINNNQSITQITLDCLINKEMYDNMINSSEVKKENLKEIKFYRKRIYDLAKRLLISKEDREIVTPDVNYAFSNFVKTSISYFKLIDKEEILQKDYEEFQEQETNINEKQEELKNYDACIMKQISMPEEKSKMTSMDNFVIRKQSEEIEESIIYPQKREFNLKDESFKNKGIKKKESKEKKNINNKYDKKNNPESKTQIQETNVETKTKTILQEKNKV
jgi:hypothetical protein|uniref:Uncharacterized protein n=1 Tax=viral metagenome TaxID=1070528 RepID=A0A6C0IMU2_9ZZZZ